MTTGERVVVTESMDEVLRRAVRFQQAKHLIPPLASGKRPEESSAARHEEA